MNGDFSVVQGRLATSRAGRDKGRCFIIVGKDDEGYVHLADGDLRKIDAPKKKKLMHVRVHPDVAEAIAAKLERQERVYDQELREAVRAWEAERHRLDT